MEDIEYCFECNKYVETHVEERYETYIIDGTTEVTLLAKVRLCNKCGEDLSDDEIDDDTLHRCYVEYKKIHSLIQSEDIKRLREELKLSQLQLAELIGCSEKQIVRIERGCLQTKEQDVMLRKVLKLGE